MLDTATKRRIDTARDILVGKVPDPKSQVEQITIALIYKFMDDMDANAEELGGKRKFFANGFSRYGWAKLMRSGLGGNEVLNLYAEAIAKMTQNPGIPPLFRNIFKNAYLPYRDPETLKSFLKIIDEFNYDHSERLGDAFEYLLSVLGSQGDAGQFRTPRHIIDFIVAPYLTSKNVRENRLDLSNVSYISEEAHRSIYDRCPVKKGDVLYVKDGANTGLAAVNILDEEFSLLSSVAVMRGDPEIMDNRYLSLYLNTNDGRQRMLSLISGVAITRLTLTKLNNAMIPLPPLATQQAIVAEIEAEQALVAANRELIARFEKKIQTAIARVWGDPNN